MQFLIGEVKNIKIANRHPLREGGGSLE